MVGFFGVVVGGVGLFRVLVGGGKYFLDGGWWWWVFCGWWWVFFEWWWVVVDRGGSWWMVAQFIIARSKILRENKIFLPM